MLPPASDDPMTPSLAEQLTLERMARSIDATNDVPTLQQLCRTLAHAWLAQQAASRWFIAHQGPQASDSPHRAAQEPQA